MYASPNRATLSILGLYQYDDTIFDDISLPTSVDENILIPNLLAECAELELIYPDWDFMKMMIDAWSEKELPTWERIAELAALEYNPIENYDRREDAVDTENRKRDTNRTDTIENTSNGNSVNNTDTLNRVAGFNTPALGVKDKSTTGNVSTVNNSGESKQSVIEGETDNSGRTHSSRIHGNIGVTTPAQMITSEMELAPQLNVINYIIKSFKQRFCLLVY